MPAARDDEGGVWFERLEVQVEVAREGAEFRYEKLDLARPQPTQQFIPVTHHHAHDDARVVGDEPGQRVGQHRLRRVRAATDVQVAGLEAALTHHVAVEIVDELRDLPDPGDENVAAVGRLDPCRSADEQAAASRALHRLNAAR